MPMRCARLRAGEKCVKAAPATGWPGSEFPTVSLLRRTALALALATALHALPQAALAETLAGAMAKAYENNPDLNAARAALRAVDENVTIAKAGMRPHVTGVAEVEGTRTNLDVRPAANLLGQRAGRQTD